MIYSRSDYKYVTGDIDNILIDGGIMPLRSDKYDLRGEDIVFLIEAITDRDESVGGQVLVRGFDQRLNHSNFEYPICSRLSSLFSGSFAKSYDDFPDAVRNIGTYQGLFDAAPHLFYRSSDMDSSYDDFRTGCQLLKEPVNRLFSDLEKLSIPHRYADGSFPTGRYDRDYTISGTNGGGSFTIRRTCCGRCFYSYYNGSGVTNVSDFTFKRNNTAYTVMSDGTFPAGMSKFKAFGKFHVVDKRKVNSSVDTQYDWYGIVNLGEFVDNVNTTTDAVIEAIWPSIVEMAHEDNGGGETQDSPFYFVPSDKINWGYGSGYVNDWQQEIYIDGGGMEIVGVLSDRTRW